MLHIFSSFFFFNDTATTEIYTLSLHDALPISKGRQVAHCERAQAWRCLVREVDRRDGKALPRAHRGLQQGPSEGASRRARGRGPPSSQPRATRAQRPSAAA